MKVDASLEGLIWVSSTIQGRKFIWDIICNTKIYQDLAGDPHEIARQLGRRQVGLQILDRLDMIDSELVFKMMREAKNLNTQQEIEHDNRSKSNDDNNTEFDLDDFIGTSGGHSGGDGITGYSSGGAFL